MGSPLPRGCFRCPCERGGEAAPRGGKAWPAALPVAPGCGGWVGLTPVLQRRELLPAAPCSSGAAPCLHSRAPQRRLSQSRSPERRSRVVSWGDQPSPHGEQLHRPVWFPCGGGKTCRKCPEGSARCPSGPRSHRDATHQPTPGHRHASCRSRSPRRAASQAERRVGT